MRHAQARQQQVIVDSFLFLRARGGEPRHVISERGVMLGRRFEAFPKAKERLSRAQVRRYQRPTWRARTRSHEIMAPRTHSRHV